jgi:hypothetical protein
MRGNTVLAALQFATIRAGSGSFAFEWRTNQDGLCRELRGDPEFELPDPEQVDRDLDQAEKRYKKDEKGKNAP